jgi:hypothetical protein
MKIVKRRAFEHEAAKAIGGAREGQAWSGEHGLIPCSIVSSPSLSRVRAWYHVTDEANLSIPIQWVAAALKFFAATAVLLAGCVAGDGAPGAAASAVAPASIVKAAFADHDKCILLVVSVRSVIPHPSGFLERNIERTPGNTSARVSAEADGTDAATMGSDN